MKSTYYTHYRDNEDHHWWFVARRLILQHVLAHYLPPNANRTVLEVGCGTGGNLEWLGSYGQLSAMEFDDRARSAANQREVCDVKPGSLPSDLPFDSTFDLVCLLDVLEHVDDDLGSLMTLSDRLTPNGRLLLTVPAYEFLWSQHDVVNHHKRRYVKHHLIDKVRKADLQVLYTSYFNTLLFPVIAGIRVIRNLLGATSDSDVAMPSQAANHILQAFFASERLLIPKVSLPFGTSILLIAGKVDGVDERPER